MTFNREALPEPMAYYEGAGLTLIGPKSSKWKTTRCDFHGGRDSMRIHVERGAFICMACGAKGGDILAFHQAAHGLDFVEAAKSLGAWQEDDKPHAPRRPTPVSPALAINVLQFEANLAAIAACNVGNGVQLTDQDKARLLQAAGRINHIAGPYQ
jgi:hypothetical protein